jgi:large subunit ribosomal protein L15
MDITVITTQAGGKKRRKRVGRGTGSGLGKTSGRGHKGCGQRAGGGVRPLSEGGQIPLFRRIPKRGFSNAQFRREVAIVNVADLERCFEKGTHVTKDALEQAGLIRGTDVMVKVLGNGELKKKLTVEVDRFSRSAAEKIAAVGGTATVLESAT